MKKYIRIIKGIIMIVYLSPSFLLKKTEVLSNSNKFSFLNSSNDLDSNIYFSTLKILDWSVLLVVSEVSFLIDLIPNNDTLLILGYN